MSQINMETVKQPALEPPSQTPACEKCGRQDETLRLVVYPFVFSIVVVTFRRALSGLWCKTHRNQNQIIASLISSIFGWIGIPFGIIYTPIVLFQLAKGGVQPDDTNIQILTAIAEEKLKKGDTPAAVRCLEECLKFRDDAEVKKRLNEIRPRYTMEKEPIGCLQIGLRLIGTLFVSILIGTIIGILDYGSRYFLIGLLGDDAPIFVVILLWAPFLASGFIGGLGMATIIEKTLLRINAKRFEPAIILAIVVSLSVTYGIFEGTVIGDNIYSLTHNQFESTAQIIVVGLITLFVGGFVGIVISAQSFIFFLIMVLLATIFFLILAIQTATKTIQWQHRITTETNINPQFGT